MPSFRTALAATLLLLLSTPAPAAPAATPASLADEAQADLTAFQHLLAEVPAHALHAALHRFNPQRFRHGVYSADGEAAHAVWSADPDLASNMVLNAKRQTGPADNSTTPSVVTSTVTATPTTPTVVVVTSTSTSTLATPTLPPTTTPLPTTPTPVPTTPSSTPTPSPTTPSSTLEPSTSVVESTTTVPTATLTLPSTTETLGTTETQSSAAGGSVMLVTTTLPNGQLSTMTAVTVVNAPASQSKESQTTPTGSLQSPDAAAGLERSYWALAGGVGAAVVLGGF